MRRFPLTFGLATWALAMTTSCATIGPPQPPSLELPRPPSDLHAVRKGNRVTLTWTLPAFTTDRQTIRSLGPTKVCRATAGLKECGTPVGEAAPLSSTPVSQSSKQKPIGTYVDTVRAQMENDAGSFIIYAVESLNSEGKGAGISNQARVSAAPTLPPPADLQARVTGQGVVLSWTAASLPPMAGVRYVYRVYRHPEGISALALAGEIPIEADRQFVLTDSTIEWQKIYLYHAEAVTIIDQQNQAQLQVEGDDTAEIKVFADNVFPPAVPTGLQTVFSGPGQQTFIDLVWAPVTDLDLAGYNVYRHEQAGAPTKLNPEPIKAPAYRDANVASGRRYVYSVSAVDIRGNESVASEEASESVP